MSVRYFSLLAYTVLLFLITIFILNSCSSSMGPEQYYENEFLGQLEADVDYAVLKPDGTVWAWGSNSTGQLGNGTLEPSDIPVQVLNLENVVAIDLCEGIGVAADKDGNICFWGNRLIWALPPELDTIVMVPKKISYLQSVKYLEVGGIYIRLLRNDGTVWQITMHHRSPTKFVHPERILGMNDIIAISDYLALKKDGTLCELPGYEFVEPKDGGLVDGLTDVKAVESLHHRRTIILKKDGTVWAWGKNSSGGLGNETYEDSAVPARVSNLTDIVAISAEGGRNLALKKDGTVWFWGLVYLNLDQNVEICQNVPIQVENLDNVRLIHAGAAIKSVVMKSDGTYWVFDAQSRIPEEVPFNNH